MSRVAKAPIKLPENVEIKITDQMVTVKGPKGTLHQKCNDFVSIINNKDSDNIIAFKPAKEDPKAWAHAGTMRALINNMVIGVTDGFIVTLELVGVGYRAQVQGNKISLSLGFSHPIEYTLPAEVTVEMPNNTTIVLKSISKQLVGQVASEIRSFRPPEPYKGKGVKYAGEMIIRKEAKKK